MNIKRDIIEYFDSFVLNCLEEFIRVSNRLNLYNGTKYQDLLSVLCGYYCLHYMNECSWNATENLHNEKLSCHTHVLQVALQIFWIIRSSSRFVWFELVMNHLGRKIWLTQGIKTCVLLSKQQNKYTNMLPNLLITSSLPLDIYAVECKQFGVCIMGDNFFETLNLPPTHLMRIRRKI